ncbi:MAG: hypothetical protein WKF84_17555 [Pyrinomonadaceae bacterium]
MENCARSTDYPTAFVARKIQVNKLFLGGDALPQPRHAAVICVQHYAVSDLIATTDGADDPTPLFVGEAYAVKLCLAAKVSPCKTARLNPAFAAVCSRKNAVA